MFTYLPLAFRTFVYYSMFLSFALAPMYFIVWVLPGEELRLGVQDFSTFW